MLDNSEQLHNKFHTHTHTKIKPICLKVFWNSYTLVIL